MDTDELNIHYNYTNQIYLFSVSGYNFPVFNAQDCKSKAAKTKYCCYCHLSSYGELYHNRSFICMFLFEQQILKVWFVSIYLYNQ